MPFRAKAKKIFGRNRTDSSSNTSSSSSSNHDVYKPGERMPPPKYRRPPLPEHTEKLESFTFADAWRKRSFQSSHSPMGTAAHSRRASMLSTTGASKSSLHKSSRANSVTSAADGMGDELTTQDTIVPGPGVGLAANDARLPPEPENEGDDDVANVGLSRVQSQNRSAPVHFTNTATTFRTAHDHHPFSEQDISNALLRARLQVPAH